MPTEQEPAPVTKPRGLPLWTVLMALLILAIVVIAGLAFFMFQLRSGKLRLQRQVQAAQDQKTLADLAQKKAAEDARLTLARNHQSELLAQVHAATNALQQLLSDTENLRLDTAALRTNTSGKTIAAIPELITLARRFLESEVPTLPQRDEITLHLEAARRIEQQLLPNLGTPYDPAPDLQQTLQASTQWAAERQLKVAAIRQELTSLVQESKVKLPPATQSSNSLTLDEAISHLNTQEADTALQTREHTAAAAKSEAELERAKAEAEKILADAKKEASAIRESIHEEDERAALERSKREAALKLDETKTQVANQKTQDEAQKLVLRQKASDPKIQAELAPFITPGYMQLHTIGAEKLPYSYSDLKNYGALTPGLPGLAKLVRIASHPGDKVRPRWKMNYQLFQRHPDNIEKVTEVQNLLIELGPVLVDMGKLQP